MASSKWPVIIAMKGYPCTGKSTLAQSLAKAMKCPLIDHERVFNCLANVQKSPSTPSAVAAEAEHLNDVSYEAVCQMALTQLSFKSTVIMDASLTQPSHLDRLLQLSKSVPARLIIIACNSRNTYTWRERLESRRGVNDGIVGWYKPSTWEDLEALMERYDWCADYDVGGVSKLVVDSTRCIREGEFVIVDEHADSESKHTHFADVLRWIRKEILGEGELGVEGKDEELRHIVARIAHPSAHIHQLAFSRKGEIDGKFACRKCLELITGPVYTCTRCDLSLHESCAELPHRREVLPHHLSPIVDPTSGKFSFPENRSCPFHTEMGFTDECMDCLFHTSLRCGLFPMVIYHRLHKGPLSFMIYPIASDTEFMCTACGETSKYMALYECPPCKIQWHIGCALLPFHFKHEIHRDPLHLDIWHAEDDSDQYFCNVCEQKRNPKHMIYSCRECDVTCHLSCMNFEE